MPIPGARYRWKRYPGGKKVRLTFQGNKVVETKKPGKPAKMVKGR